MSKQLKTQEEKSLTQASNQGFDLSNFVEGGIEAQDIKIPKALIVQSMSTAKRENKNLKDGDLFLSTSKEAIISLGEKVEFNPIFVEKLMQVFKNETGVATYEGSKRGDWIRTEAVTAHNKHLPEIDTDEIRPRNMACYSQIMSDKVASTFPTRLDFKGSSKKSFQIILEKVIAHAESGKARSVQAPQLDLVFSLELVEQINKSNQAFYVLTPRFERLTTDEEYARSLKQMEMVKSLSTEEKYNDSDVADVEVPF